MFKVDPTLFSSAENNIILGIKELETLKKNMNECALSFPDSYEFSKDVYDVFLKICNLHFDSDELLNKVTFAKKKLCELDKNFAFSYYACTLQAYSEVSGDLTKAQQEYINYSQSQYYNLLYEMLDANKDNLTTEQAEIYNALKEQKTIEKKYKDLEKLYKEKEDNNGFFHPIIESDLNKKIAKLEKELGIYENKWYEDIGQAFSKTGAEWSEGFSSLLAGEGFGELWDATKQTFATGAVVSRSVSSGVAKIGEFIVVDGLSFVGGSLASGATWLFHDIWTDNDLADNVMDSTLDFVRRDLVGDLNTNFYENTSYGQWLNDTSNLKYDSAGAKAIQTGSEFVGKIVLATAATIFSGGMAAPLAIGALYGTGKASERYAQSVDRENAEAYSYDKALGKALAGAVGGSAEFYGYGRMGSAIYNGLSGIGSSATANVSQASTSTLKNFKRNFLEVDTFLDSGAVVADHGIDFLTGDKSFDEMLKSGGTELLVALSLNAVGAGIGAKMETNSALKQGASYFKQAGDLDGTIKPYAVEDTIKFVASSDTRLRTPIDSDLEGVVFANSGPSHGINIMKNADETTNTFFKQAGDLDGTVKPYAVDDTIKSVSSTDTRLRTPIDSDLEGVVFANSGPSHGINVMKNADETTSTYLKSAGDLDEIESPYVLNGVTEEKLLSKDEFMEHIEIKQVSDLNKVDTSLVDLEDAKKFIIAKNETVELGTNDLILTSPHFYTPMEFDVSVEEVVKNLEKDIPGFNVMASHVVKGDYGNPVEYDYRISLMTGDNFKISEMETFLRKFDETCTKENLPYNIKVSFDEADALIIYTRERDLIKYKEVLDNIANSEISEITTKFHKKPFSVGGSDNSYYGISMGSDINATSRVGGSLAGKGHRTTFGDYTEEISNIAYSELYSKYNGDISKITPEEFLDTMKKVHKTKQGLGTDVNIPIWMNKKIYNSFNE